MSGGWLAPRRRRLLAGLFGALGTRTALRVVGGFSALGALAACSPPRHRPNEFEARERAEIERFAQRAYRGAEEQVGEELRDSWPANGEEVDISVLMPLGPGPFPLVIYLPGFTESAGDGAAWRRTFAEAGYAVIAMQTRSAGGGARNAGQAPAGNRGPARDQFAAASLAARQGAVGAVLTETIRRVTAKQPPFSRLDTSRVAVVGFDLGAQTAQLLAGEQYPGVEALPAMPELRSVIAISPYANPGGGDFSKRFAGMRLPVLSVTGSDDFDEWGIVTTTAARQAPFRYMPPGGKYLLALDGATHKMLAGTADAPGEAERPEDGDEAPLERGRGRGPGGGPMGGRGGRGGGPDGPGGGGPGGPRGGPGGGRVPIGDFPGGRGPGDRGAARRLAGIRIAICIKAVTTAFLDATVKDDPVAGEWLQRNAPGWLGNWGVYQSR